MKFTKLRWLRSALLASTALAAFAFVACLTSPIYMVDQGDYARTTSRIFVDKEVGTAEQGQQGRHLEWGFASPPFMPNPSSGISSFLFAMEAHLVRPISDTFDIRVAGAVAKLLALGGAFLVANGLARTSSAPRWQPYLVIGGFGLIYLAEHNAAYLQSFYGEYAFFAGLPMLIASLHSSSARSGIPLLFGGLMLCAGAKLQYFYLPTIVLFVYLGARVVRRQRLSGAMIGLLLVSQVIVSLPLGRNSYAHINSYHAAYFGALLVLTPEERELADMPPELEQCIGVDAWGNRISGAGSDKTTASGLNCISVAKVSLVKSLAIYWANPSLFIRLVTQSMPTHFTVNYFHLDSDYRYIRYSEESSSGVRAFPGFLSGLRDSVVDWRVFASVLSLATVASALVLLRSKRSSSSALAAGVLILSVFAVSQVVVSLLGEGVRDLSKHLAGAQLSFDVAVLLALIMAVDVLGNVRRPSESPARACDSENWLVG